MRIRTMGWILLAVFLISSFIILTRRSTADTNNQKGDCYMSMEHVCPAHNTPKVFKDADYGGPQKITKRECRRRAQSWSTDCKFEVTPIFVAADDVELALMSQKNTECRNSAATDIDEGPKTILELTPDATFIASKKYADYVSHIEAIESRSIKTLREQFDEHGFIVFKPDIPAQVLDDAQQFTEQVYKRCIVNPESESEPICRNFHQDKYTHQGGVRKLALDKSIMAMLAVLHQHDPYPFQTLNYPCTSLARTHSDYVHFAAHPLPLMSAAWTALIDVDPKAGPVFYYPGSHKKQHYNMQDFGLEDRGTHPHNYAKYQSIMEAAMKRAGLKRQLAIIKRGEVLIWSANLVHGGPPATQEKLRRLSQVTHYFFRNSNYNWAPVASNLEKGMVEFYDEDKINEKWATDSKHTSAERFKMSKFKAGDCTVQDGISPCAMQHRMPAVMTEMLKYEQKVGEVIM